MRDFTIRRAHGPISITAPALRRLPCVEVVMVCLALFCLPKTVYVTPAKLLETIPQPTLKPCAACMLTDCGSIFCAAAGSCWIAVGCETSRLNSYPSAFASFVYICTSN